MDELTEDFEILIVAWLKSGDENATNLAHSLAKHAEKAFFIQRVSNNEAVLQYEPCLKGKLNSCKCTNDEDCKEQSEVAVCRHQWIVNTHSDTKYCSKGCDGFKIHEAN